MNLCSKTAQPHTSYIISTRHIKTYMMRYNKNNHYNVVIYCPHAKNKNSIKKIKIFNKHLLIDIGERKYRYGFEGKGEYTIRGLACMMNLPLPNNAEIILKYDVRNGVIHVEVNKST